MNENKNKQLNILVLSSIITSIFGAANIQGEELDNRNERRDNRPMINGENKSKFIIQPTKSGINSLNGFIENINNNSVQDQSINSQLIRLMDDPDLARLNKEIVKNSMFIKEASDQGIAAKKAIRDSIMHVNGIMMERYPDALAYLRSTLDTSSIQPYSNIITETDPGVYGAALAVVAAVVTGVVVHNVVAVTSMVAVAVAATAVAAVAVASGSTHGPTNLLSDPYYFGYGDNIPTSSPKLIEQIERFNNEKLDRIYYDLYKGIQLPRHEMKSLDPFYIEDLPHHPNNSSTIKPPLSPYEIAPAERVPPDYRYPDENTYGNHPYGYRYGYPYYGYPYYGYPYYGYPEFNFGNDNSGGGWGGWGGGSYYGYPEFNFGNDNSGGGWGGGSPGGAGPGGF
ncbi:MAG: hypothetical protein AB2784_05635 [Candidatus Thiodiazotropha endolucinida]